MRASDSSGRAARAGGARSAPQIPDPRSKSKWSPVLSFLHHPGVAVGVAEVGERVVAAVLRAGPGQPLAGVEVPDLADLQAALDELGARRLDVGHDQVRPPD